MCNENKMRIICNPYKKEISYEWYDYNLNDYVEFDSENSKLASDELVNTTIQNRAHEIVDIINDECNVGNVGLEIVFVGTTSDYEDFCTVINTYYEECNIKCVRDTHYYNSATEVLPEIKGGFSEIRATLDEYTEDDIAQLIYKYNDAVKPSISLCIVGLYSAGKSAFINSIIGEEILPSDSDPTTAKVCKIVCSKEYKIKFLFDDKECVLTFDKEDYKPNSNFEKDIIKELQEIVRSQEKHDEAYHMNAALSIINNYKDEKHKISDVIEIEVPFVKTSLPVEEFDFVIYDTPGSNSKNNVKHFEVLRDSLDEQTNALPIFLTTPDTMDAEDNDKLLNLIADTGTALDTTNVIIVVNKSDEKGEKTLREKRDKIKELSLTKWKSTRIFFVSSVIAMASKKDNPDDPEQWFDEDIQEIYDEKSSKYANDKRKLFQFNIVDKSKMDEIENYKDETLTTHLYKNSGLESVEREIVEYAQRYALYNKCYQASSYLQMAIDICVENIQNTEKQLNIALNEAKNHFNTKQKELCRRLEEKKKDITVYNTEFQKLMQDEFKQYTAEYGGIGDGDLGDLLARMVFSHFLKKEWKELKAEEKRDKEKKKNSWALTEMQYMAEKLYNDLLQEFSTKVNEQIVSFWERKSKLFKNECISIVRDSPGLTNEQKKILESVVLCRENMYTYKMNLDLRKFGAIRKKKFLLWELKSERFDAKTCVASIVSMFYDSVGKRINSTILNNEKNFKIWTDGLIAKLTVELCKFNSDLDESKKKIARYEAEITEKKTCESMLKENQQYIERLLDIQYGE